MNIQHVSVKSIPMDVVGEILQHVDAEQLPILALVSREYQVQSERLLYRKIVLYRMDVKACSCLNTISTVPHKARLVKSMSVQWWPASTTSGIVVKSLGNALLAVTSLKHLHLRFQSIASSTISKIINPILKRCTFSITRLFISEYIDLASWIPKQKDLKVIGVYTSPEYPSLKKRSVYKRLLENSPPEDPLTLYSLIRDGRFTDTICAFPMYSHNWSAKVIHASLVHVLSPVYITRFNLFFLNLSDEDVLRPAITSISEHFPQIDELKLIVKDPDIHLKPDVLSSILSSMPSLLQLWVEYQSLDSRTVSPYQENRDGLARSWAEKCPKLNFVVFPDRTSSSIST